MVSDSVPSSSSTGTAAIAATVNPDADRLCAWIWTLPVPVDAKQRQPRTNDLHNFMTRTLKELVNFASPGLQIPKFIPW
jgi:hypothetical protein